MEYFIKLIVCLLIGFFFWFAISLTTIYLLNLCCNFLPEEQVFRVSVMGGIMCFTAAVSGAWVVKQ